MSAVLKQDFPVAVGDPFEGGYFAGLFGVSGRVAALIVAPKATGELKATSLSRNYPAPRASSINDGIVNTLVLEKESEIASWALGLEIAGHKDWYIPSIDELEILYRAFKPTTRENFIYNRSGLNLSALPATPAYTLANPLQTSIDLFRAGNTEAFEDDWYWSSTVLEDPNYAWYQNFYNGYQGHYHVYYHLRARAVRRSFL
jgi:hypothetical protein